MSSGNVAQIIKPGTKRNTQILIRFVMGEE